MKKITATFTGDNGSMGYKTWQQYDLTLREVIRSGEIHITRDEDEEGKCLYDNFLKFLDNWTHIQSH